MKLRRVVLIAANFLALSSNCRAQGNPKLENATTAVVRAFESHNIVLFGEIHGNKQEYEWLRSLVATPEFADRVDDIVMEFGNSLYQKSVDRYVGGKDVPLEEVQRAWLNTVGAIGPPSPVYASLYLAVRETNLKRRGKHQIRILCGDPYIDWEKVKDREDIAPYLSNRDQWYTQVVKDEVLAKHHRALLIMGSGHLLRAGLHFPGGQRAFSIEQQLREAGARTYLITFGTNVIGGYDDLDHRFDSWPAPVVVSLADNWVGELLALPVVLGGAEGPPILMKSSSGATGPSPPPPPAPPSPVKLKDAADALLYLGRRDSLVGIGMSRAELVGTPYEKEIERRLMIEGFPEDFIAGLEARNSEAPQFSRPRSLPASDNAPVLPPPRNIGAPLPPRPPSQ